jgi:acetate kinase
VGGLEELIDLAPLHNPYNLRGIAAARATLGRCHINSIDDTACAATVSTERRTDTLRIDVAS